MKNFRLILLFACFFVQTASAQTEKPVRIINGGVRCGKATSLPRPPYPNDAKKAKVSGSVHVKVLVGVDGKVETAEAVSGHELLRKAAEQAALAAKFAPTQISGESVKVSGIITYNFTADSSDSKINESSSDDLKTGKKISLGVVNDNAKILVLPKSQYAPHQTKGTVNVQVEINLQTGEVVSASAVSGHLLLRMPAEKAARQTKFEPTLTEFSTIYGTGILIYKIEDFTGKTVENENSVPLFSSASGGILNGKAINLEKPEYPKEAEDFCVGGKVEVAVLIYDATGEVIAAKAVSGNELFWKSAEEAVLKTKFSPTLINGKNDYYLKGKIVFNFVPKRKCINVGIVNTRAIKLPKPPFPTTFNGKITKKELVVVQITVDESGNVIYAKSIAGHPVFRQISEAAAGQTKFFPTNVNGPPVKVNAFLAYKFNFDGTVETKIEQEDKDFIGLPIDLIEPSPIFCNCNFGENPSVIVQVEIDEKGDVTKATAISGHPILKQSSEKAALESKFIPANVKTSKYIRNNFEEINKHSVKISNVEMTELQIK